MSELVTTCVWRVTAELVTALDSRFGEPVDAYVNGSQVWLRDDGPGGAVLEWRLHPVPGYVRPQRATTYDVFPSVALTLASGADPVAPLSSLWDGLEVFAAYGEEIEPATLAAHGEEALGVRPDGFGLVDHQRVGDKWERSGRSVSITEALLRQLNTPGNSGG
jgi:hypothetical protein